MKLKRNQGHVFEDDIVRTLNQYQYLNLLRAKKVDPPCKVLRIPGRPPIVQFLPNPFLDFSGAWTERQGRAVFFEAKSTQEPRLALNSDSGVKETQIDAMRHWQGAGAVTFVLWHHKGVVKLVRLETITATLKVRKSLPWDVGSLVCPQGKGFVLYDFLKIMRTVWI